MDALHTNQLFNTEFNRMNGIYRILTQKYSMPECQFWILYALYEKRKPLTQSELKEYLISPKQTIHSSIQKLMEQNFITLTKTHGKKKYFSLTEEGRKLAEETVGTVQKKEILAFKGFSEEEREQFISLLSRYCDLLEKEAL